MTIKQIVQYKANGGLFKDLNRTDMLTYQAWRHREWLKTDLGKLYSQRHQQWRNTPGTADYAKAKRHDAKRSLTPRYKEALTQRHIKCTRQLKLDIIIAYGGRCACCGECIIEFLCIDHIFNDGEKERREIGSSNKLYTRLRQQGYPKGRYRVLCQNCNSSLGSYGYCPHGGLDND